MNPLVLHAVHHIWFVLIILTPLWLCSFPLLFQYEGSSPRSRFLSRPSNLFLPLQDKYCVRGLCFPPAPSQRIYDGPAVWAISQGPVFTVEVC